MQLLYIYSYNICIIYVCQVLSYYPPPPYTNPMASHHGLHTVGELFNIILFIRLHDVIQKLAFPLVGEALVLALIPLYCASGSGQVLNTHTHTHTHTLSLHEATVSARPLTPVHRWQMPAIKK